MDWQRHDRWELGFLVKSESEYVSTNPNIFGFDVTNNACPALATEGNLSKEGLEDEEERVRERPMRGNLFKTMSQFSYV